MQGVPSKMKIRILSDLHLEFQDWTPPESDADVVVLAGDIHVGTRGIDWALDILPRLKARDSYSAVQAAQSSS